METLMAGLNFMIIGMSVVFSFLVIMIISMSILKVVVGLLNKYFPEKEESAAKPAARSAKADDAAIAVAIAAAYAASKK